MTDDNQCTTSQPTMRLRWNFKTGKLQQQWFVRPFDGALIRIEWRDVETYYENDDATTTLSEDAEP